MSSNKYNVDYGTGNARRSSYRAVALPRMTNTIVLPGKDPLNDVINGFTQGIELFSCIAGSVDYMNGDVTIYSNDAQLADGKEKKNIRDMVAIKTNAIELLKSIKQISHDVKVLPGSCIKKGQMYVL